MRNAIIFHGTGAQPGLIWYPWLAGRLRERGYDVVVPHHPGINVDPLEEVLPDVLAHRFDAETVLVGHSGGAALLLAILERLEAPVARSVLVAGYATMPGSHEPVLQADYDWPTIRRNAGELWFVNSVTDPYGCDVGQGLAMQRHLGGTLVVRNDPAPPPARGAEWVADPRHFETDTLDLVDRLIP